MRRTVLLVAVALVPLVAGVALAGTGGERAKSVRALQGVNFVSACGFSHRAPDDPIVYPGQPGRRTTTASSATAPPTPRRRTGRCSPRGRRAAAPTTRPRTGCRRCCATAARSSRSARPSTTVGARSSPCRPFPPNFRMIAGDAKATTAQARRVTFWNCGVAAGIPPSSEPPSCPAGRATTLRLHVTFPSCWDGRRLDSPDHQSHIAYPMRGRCPRTHPVALPALTVITATATSAAPVSRSRPRASTPRTPTSSTPGVRTSSSGSSPPA